MLTILQMTEELTAGEMITAARKLHFEFIPDLVSKLAKLGLKTEFISSFPKNEVAKQEFISDMLSPLALKYFEAKSLACSEYLEGDAADLDFGVSAADGDIEEVC